MKFEFKKYTPTPGEKYLGIAEIKILGETPIILRFKIVPRKDGKGNFPAIASYKMPNRDVGDEYDECFMLDSRSDNEECIKTIMHHVSQNLKLGNYVNPSPVYMSNPPPPEQMTFMDKAPVFDDPPF